MALVRRGDDGLVFRPEHLLKLLFGRASRCYEFLAPALDALAECFEQRDSLASRTNTQKLSASGLDSQAFGGAKPARVTWRTMQHVRAITFH